MPRHRLHPRVALPTIALMTGLLMLAGCDRQTARAPADSLAASGAEPTSGVRPAGADNGWSASDGPVLLVQGNSWNEAIVLLPSAIDSAAISRLDSASEEGGAAQLFGRGGARFSGRLGAAPAEADVECRVWPLQDVRGAGGASTWSVGFLGGQAAALALDSVEVLPARDSMAVAAEASRLASAVTAPNDPMFQGLRFTAHDVRRFEVAPGIQGMIAHLVRKVNQEANPQEEQTLVIGERETGADAGPFRLVYAERTHGLEEDVATPEVIAAVRLGGTQRPTFVIARDSDEGVSYSLVERNAPGRWRVRWTSSVTRCGAE